MRSHGSEDPSYYKLEMCEHFDENRVEVCVKTGSEQGLLFHFLLKKFPRLPILLFSDYFIADLALRMRVLSSPLSSLQKNLKLFCMKNLCR